MRPSTVLTAILALASGTLAYSTANATISQVVTFPPTYFAESIAVRSNSHLLVTTPGTSHPQLWSINPKAAVPTAEVVYSWSNGSTPWSITEVAPDVFAVVTGIWDFSPRAQLGSLAIWTVNFNVPGPSPHVRFVTQVLNSTIINGIVRHPLNPLLLLGADSAAGAIWKINLVTGAHSILLSSPLLLPVGTEPGTNLGINGLTASGTNLYFTNSAQGFLGKIALGAGGNQISIVAHSPEGIIYDDLDLDKTEAGVSWIASHPSHVVRVAPGGGQEIINNATLLKNPTASAFGRGDAKQRRTLYVTNGGEFTPDLQLFNAGVVAVELQ